MAKRFQYPIKRSPRYDPQQYRVYRMENEAIGARRYMHLTRRAVRQLADSICRNYRVPRVKLSWCDLGKWAAEWDNGVIRLNTNKSSSQDLLTLTHELAHHIHFHLGGKHDLQEPHGPEFMACHMSVLDTVRMIPVVGMRAICKTWKVRYADPGTRSSLKRLCRITKAS
jgi:hypothetical protein